MDDRRRRFEAQAMPHLDAAYNLARWLARSRSEADDIVQDAMLRAYRAFDGFRGGDAKPWLLAIVRNCHLTALGKRRRRHHESLPEPEAADDLAFASQDPDAESIVIAADQSRKLDTVIAQLPLEYREVLILREMEDMSYRDIASVTGVPIGTVMSRLARARAALRERWLTDVEGGCHGLQ
ncbi:MAG: sigma-70 family RNA polymerase sigma factor [Rhizomicrobium sp.]|jgi:RNA polymerase sigma-70 factor (ECF subfamily)